MCVADMGTAVSKTLASNPEENDKALPSDICVDVDSVLTNYLQ